MGWSLSSKKDQENTHLISRVMTIYFQPAGRAGILRAALIKATFANRKTRK
jgi:hypothetical protein